ncbi:MAG: hypothetical protein HOV66_23725 [Streptomycetaceae bacterium]|nr:hypothetical protein [Streptomycetaceae bacterium]
MIPTARDMEATHYGLLVAAPGDDDHTFGFLALGHHVPRRALAAFHALDKSTYGELPAAAALGPLVPEIRHAWGVFTAGTDQDSYAWTYQQHDEPTPGAVPVTVLDLV